MGDPGDRRVRMGGSSAAVRFVRLRECGLPGWESPRRAGRCPGGAPPGAVRDSSAVDTKSGVSSGSLPGCRRGLAGGSRLALSLGIACLLAAANRAETADFIFEEPYRAQRPADT